MPAGPTSRADASMFSTYEISIKREASQSTFLVLMTAATAVGVGCAQQNLSVDPLTQQCARATNDRDDWEWPPGKLGTLDPGSLVGEYRLCMVLPSESRNEGSVTVTGAMTLVRYDSAYQLLFGVENPTTVAYNRFPLRGATTVPVAKLGVRGIAIAPDSRDPRRPGIVAIFDKQRQTLVFLLGGTPGMMDAGLSLLVDRLEPDQMCGRWIDDGPPVSNYRVLRGYFCAFRVQLPRN